MENEKIIEGLEAHDREDDKSFVEYIVLKNEIIKVYRYIDAKDLETTLRMLKYYEGLDTRLRDHEEKTKTDIHNIDKRMYKIEVLQDEQGKKVAVVSKEEKGKEKNNTEIIVGLISGITLMIVAGIEAAPFFFGP